MRHPSQEGQRLADIGIVLNYDVFPPAFPASLYNSFPTKDWDRLKPAEWTRLRHQESFVNTRNPFTRIFASWKDKFRIGPKKNQIYDGFAKKAKKFETKNPQKGFKSSFDAFVKFIDEDGKTNSRPNVHWRKQDSLCQPCNTNYTFVSHIEGVLKF